jgi:L-aminopeptidase/D-esterase-like protein
MQKQQAVTHSLGGVHVGCAEYDDGPTGCTVVYFEAGASCVALATGGAIAGRDLQGASLNDHWGEIDALLFTGGSSWGLAATDGVVAALTRMNGGSMDFETIPSVPSVAVYDFTGRDNDVAPDPELGQRALEHAQAGEVPVGPVGAGRNVTVGTYLGDEYREPSGQGAAAASLDGAKILVVTVVNACGNVLDRAGRVLRGGKDPETGERLSVAEGLLFHEGGARGGNTVLTAVITDAALERTELHRLAAIVDAGLARVIEPFHTEYDGDVVFACSTAQKKMPRGRSVSDLGAVAARCAQDAVLSSFR